ncbi:MAG: YlxR family protein [Eubacterium sp.]|nr:YlxR family protein [Eubacterium sp.]
MNKKIPMRQCVGCREMKPKRELIRVIRTAEDTVCIDTTGKKNGRGAYLCPNQECLDKAVKSKGLEHSLKMAVPKDIYTEFEKEII